ncbi:MAG TPA: prepilin-type N-terminal cleavage/methylation domain-containing protein [Isosphaeraceae bacterium]|nr:prepilin-type N-terminal cleavage/methylation domain-containing protein [Isosphaeraceae bacterium]
MDSPAHIKGRSARATRQRGFSLLEVMIVTVVSGFVFAAVLSAYIFLGRGLMRQSNEEQLESRCRQALYDFTQDMSAASAVISANATTLTVNTWIPQTVGSAPVMGTATYEYVPAEGQLTLTRTAPPAATPAFPNWPTPPGPPAFVLLNNVTNFSFGTYDMGGISTGVLGLVKQVNMSFTTTAGSQIGGAQSHVTVVSPQVILKNKSSPQ